MAKQELFIPTDVKNIEMRRKQLILPNFVEQYEIEINSIEGYVSLPCIEPLDNGKNTIREFEGGLEIITDREDGLFGKKIYSVDLVDREKKEIIQFNYTI